MRDEFTPARADVAGRRDHWRQLQIVMRLKSLPVTPVRLPEVRDNWQSVAKRSAVRSSVRRAVSTRPGVTGVSPVLCLAL